MVMAGGLDRAHARGIDVLEASSGDGRLLEFDIVKRTGRILGRGIMGSGETNGPYPCEGLWGVAKRTGLMLGWGLLRSRTSCGCSPLGSVSHELIVIILWTFSFSSLARRPTKCFGSREIGEFRDAASWKAITR